MPAGRLPTVSMGAAIMGVVMGLVAGLAGLSGCSKGEQDAAKASAAAPAAAVALSQAPKSLGGVAVKVPEGWHEEAVGSPMRKAQWKIGGEAELVVYHFGAGGAGSVEKNLERWFGQFAQADGRPTRDVAEVRDETIAGVKVTRVSVGGRYVAQVRPGANERHDIADARMLAAIVEAADGAYYFKMVGPDAVVRGAEPGFDAMLASLSVPPGN